MKLTQSKVFWILQIIGWNSLAINSWAKYFTNTDLNKSYIISEGLLFIISGIFCSSLLRLYLKNNINFGKLDKQMMLNIILAYSMTSLLLFMTMYLAIPLYNYFHDKVLGITKLMLLSNVLNTFIFMALWLLFYIGIKIFIHMREAKIERLQLKTELKEAQLNTLKGQINPHFMFNSLNNIRGLMLEDVEKSREMITRLSEILRYSLTKDNIDSITISEEIEMVENYIALSQIQLEDRLKYECIIADNLLKIEIPPMIIQMLVENAVKHGISNQANGGMVSLEIFANETRLNIKVTNTGNLKSTSNSTKLGLDNIKKRLQLIYKNTAKFDLSEVDNYVIATIKLPHDN